MSLVPVIFCLTIFHDVEVVFIEFRLLFEDFIADEITSRKRAILCFSRRLREAATLIRLSISHSPWTVRYWVLRFIVLALP